MLCSCNLELIEDECAVVFTGMTSCLQVIGNLSIVLGDSALLVATESVSAKV